MQTNEPKQVVINWIFAEGNPPEIDQDDIWNKEDEVSKTVLSISEYGVKFAKFYHRSGNWSIEGIISSKKQMPKYWAYVVLP